MKRNVSISKTIGSLQRLLCKIGVEEENGKNIKLNSKTKKTHWTEHI